MKYIRNGKVIKTTERLYNMIYRQIGYLPVEDLPVEDLEIEDLEELTVKELKEKAEALELENYNGLKKDELIALIKGE